MEIFAHWAIPSHRKNFEEFMLMLQYHQMMSDLKKMPQEISEALSKSTELTKENQSYWWVTTMVMTQALGTECVCLSLSLNQSEDSGYISVASSKESCLLQSKARGFFFTSRIHCDQVWRVCEPLHPLSFPTQYPWDRKGLHHHGDINQPWASCALKGDI